MTSTDASRRVVRVFAVSTAVAALVAVLGDRWLHGPTASASGFHVACTGTACDGRDPQDTGCGVAPQTLVSEQVADGAAVEIRYSPDCRAVWARVWNTQLGDVLTLDVPDDPSQRVSVADPASQAHFVYTPLDGLSGENSVVKACLTSKTPGGAGCFSAVVP